MSATDICDPITYKDAIDHKYSQEWLKSINTEIFNLKRKDTWTLVDPPNGVNIISSRWVHKTKLDSEGNILKRKSRWVAKGFKQQYGIDYLETFTYTVKPVLFRLLFTLAAILDWEIHQWDFILAFLNAVLNEKIYMQQLKGFKETINQVHLLKKAIYGLK